jgi:hypothetical protein
MQQSISPARQKVRERPRRAETDRSVGGVPAVEASEERHLPHALPQDGFIGVAYERFLEMPVSVVLAVLWVLGMALLGSCVLTLYVLGTSLVGVVVG